jgi:ATP synthase protein I
VPAASCEQIHKQGLRTLSVDPSHDQPDDANAERPMTNDLTKAAAQAAGGSEAMDFISSVIAGLVLGLGLDWWLGTRPIFIVIGIVLGFVSGFYKLWGASAILEQQAEERRRD